MHKETTTMAVSVRTGRTTAFSRALTRPEDSPLQREHARGSRYVDVRPLGGLSPVGAARVARKDASHAKPPWGRTSPEPPSTE